MTARAATLAALALAAVPAPALAAPAPLRVIRAQLLAGPVIAGPKVAWGEGRHASADAVKTLVVRARGVGRGVLSGKLRTLYASSLPAQSRYDSQLFAEMDASQAAIAVILDLDESCCGSVFRVRGALLNHPFRRLSSTEGPRAVDVDGTRISFVEDASYSNAQVDPSAPLDAPCDEPGTPACSTIVVRDLRDPGAPVLLPAPPGQTFTQLRAAGRYLAWLRSGAGITPTVTVWDLNAGAEAFSVDETSLRGPVEGLDLQDDGTLALVVGGGGNRRILTASPARPAPLAQTGEPVSARVRISADRIAFQDGSGIMIAALGGRPRRVATARRLVNARAWDLSGNRLTWATPGRGRSPATVWFARV